MTIDDCLADGAVPVIAIRRGLRPEEAIDIASALINSGLRMIEVPLNSPDPFASIAAIQERFGGYALIGAGVAAGPEVIPGFLTPSEGFAAVAAGTRRLKLFPASAQAPAFIKTISEVLPVGIGIWAVGGIDTAIAWTWLEAGAEGIALGSAIYRPGDTAGTVARKAEAIVGMLKMDTKQMTWRGE